VRSSIRPPNQHGTSGIEINHEPNPADGHARQFQNRTQRQTVERLPDLRPESELTRRQGSQGGTPAEPSIRWTTQYSAAKHPQTIVLPFGVTGP